MILLFSTYKKNGYLITHIKIMFGFIFRVRKIEPKELIEVEPDIPSDSDFR